jgi:hypothetical protein
MIQMTLQKMVSGAMKKFNCSEEKVSQVNGHATFSGGDDCEKEDKTALYHQRINEDQFEWAYLIRTRGTPCNYFVKISCFSWFSQHFFQFLRRTLKANVRDQR